MAHIPTPPDTDGKVKDDARAIRQSFRSLMNGVAATRLRTAYRVVWGCSLPHLREVATEFTPSVELATVLWHDNVRESKIMALLLMPPAACTRDTARTWAADTPTQEIAEIAAMTLYQYLPFASDLAAELIAASDRLQQIAGYATYTRLFNSGRKEFPPSYFIKYAIEALQSNDQHVTYAAAKALNAAKCEEILARYGRKL